MRTIHSSVSGSHATSLPSSFAKLAEGLIPSPPNLSHPFVDCTFQFADGVQIAFPAAEILGNPGGLAILSERVELEDFGFSIS